MDDFSISSLLLLRRPISLKLLFHIVCFFLSHGSCPPLPSCPRLSASLTGVAPSGSSCVMRDVCLLKWQRCFCTRGLFPRSHFHPVHSSGLPMTVTTIKTVNLNSHLSFSSQQTGMKIVHLIFYDDCYYFNSYNLYIY